jgi:hypothetical protein
MLVARLRFVCHFLKQRLHHRRISSDQLRAPSKSIEEHEATIICCGNGCRDCVLIKSGATESDDYFAKMEAHLSASATPKHSDGEKPT